MDSRTVEAARQKAQILFSTGEYRCAEVVCLVVCDVLDRLPSDDEAICRFSGLPVGTTIAEYGCGAVIGGIKALAQYDRHPVAGHLFEMAETLRHQFKTRHHLLICPAAQQPFRPVPPEYANRCLAIISEVATDVIELVAMN